MSVSITACAIEADPLISRALAAYHRSAALAGGTTVQPSARSYRGTFNGRKYVVLLGVRTQVLAVYRVRPQGLLKRLIAEEGVFGV
jgi:hypothetical protein